MKGRLIVFEGLDGSGKTTTIEQLLKKLDNSYVYNKGLGSDTFIGRLASKFPSTLFFLLDLFYVTHTRIKPALNAGKNVLQDRYFQSVASYLPDSIKLHNKILIKLFNKLLLKPDALIYLTVSAKERISRLKSKALNKHHMRLIQDPHLITTQEKNYRTFYNAYNGSKHVINTTHKNINDVACAVVRKLCLKQS